MTKILIALLFIPFGLTSQVKVSNAFYTSIGDISRSAETVKNRNNKWFKDESCYLLTENNQVIDVQYLNKKVKLRLSSASSLSLNNELIYEDFPKNFTPIKILSFSNNYFYVFTAWDKKQNINNLFFREIDIEKGSFKNAQLVAQKLDSFYPYNSEQIDDLWKNSVDGIIFSESKDGSKLLVEIDNGPSVDKNKKRYSGFKFLVFDTNMTVIQEKFTKIYSETNTYITRLIKNDGTIVLLALNTTKKNLSIYSMSKTSKEFEEHVLMTETSISFIGFDLQEAKNGALIGSCNYTISNKAKGDYVIELTNDFQIVKEYKFPYSLAIINQNSEVRYHLIDGDISKDAGIEFLVYRGMQIEKDGSFCVYSEVFYDDYDYRLKNILISKFSKNFNLLWTRNIAKSQRSLFYYGGDSSFKIFFEEDNVYLVFIDNDKNLNKEEYKPLSAHIDGKAGVITIVKIDNKGEITKYPIFEMVNDQQGEFSYFQKKKVHFNKKYLEFYISLIKSGYKDVLLKVMLD